MRVFAHVSTLRVGAFTVRASMRTVGMVIVAYLLSGCATIVSGRTQDIAFHSVPAGADVLLNDGTKTVTPGTLTLKRRGNYMATFTKEPFPARPVEIQSTGNWWVLGNVLIGGFIGIIVDVVTGAAHRLVPDYVMVDMATGSVSTRKDDVP
jgi:hypothetical protein